jgi:hypothetical protein
MWAIPEHEIHMNASTYYSLVAIFSRLFNCPEANRKSPLPALFSSLIDVAQLTVLRHFLWGVSLLLDKHS